jgi:hypothetical protein
MIFQPSHRDRIRVNFTLILILRFGSREFPTIQAGSTNNFRQLY